MRALAMIMPNVEHEVVNVPIDSIVYRYFVSQKNKRKLFVKYKDKKGIKSRLFQITTSYNLRQKMYTKISPHQSSLCSKKGSQSYKIYESFLKNLIASEIPIIILGDPSKLHIK